MALGRPTVLLLPGMDGTGDLFKRFQSALSLPSEVIRYRADEPLGFDDLAARIKVPEHSVIVAESFSGPIGLRLAAKHGCTLVWVGSFCHSPSWLLSHTPSPLLRAFTRFPIPSAIVRSLLVGATATAADVAWVHSAIRHATPAVLAHRLGEIARTDCGERLHEFKPPFLYLGGQADRLVGARARKAVLSARSTTEVRLIDGPHLLLQMRPTEAASEIEAFIGR